MLIYCLIFIYFTHIAISAELNTTTKKPVEAQTNIDSKFNKTTVQRTALKAGSKPVKLTFHTLYPKFMSSWSTNKIIDKKTKDKIRNIKEERNNSGTKKINRTELKTIEDKTQKHNAFIEVDAMKRYVPIKITASKSVTQTRKIRNPIKRSQNSTLNNLNLKQKYRNIRTKVTVQETGTNIQRKHEKHLNSFKQHLQQKRFTTKIPNSHTLRVVNAQTDKLIKEQEVFNRLKKLQNDLNNIKSVVKNGSDIINNLKIEVQKKGKNEFNERHNTSSISKRSDFEISHNNKEKTTVKISSEKTTRKDKYEDKNIKTTAKLNKHQRRLEWLKQNILGVAPSKANDDTDVFKNFDRLKNAHEKNTHIGLINTRNTDKGIEKINKQKINLLTTTDPLAYDSLELALEHDMAMKELSEMLDQNSLTVKPDSVKDTRRYQRRHSNLGKTASKEAAQAIQADDIDRVFAPKPGYNITAVLNANKNIKSDQNTGVSGRQLLDRFDIAGAKSNIGAHNKYNNLDYIKYVDHVMQQNSVPLLERRNILKKTVDEQLNDLYKRHNLVPNNNGEERFDTALKAIGANLYK